MLKKYQILSKNTSLFAEIPNEENQQSKLIKVNLNEFKNRIPSFSFSSINNLICCGSAPKRGMMMAARPKMMKTKYFCSSKMKMKSCAPSPSREENVYNNSIQSANLFDFSGAKNPPPSPPAPFNNHDNKNKNIKDDITRIIMSQDTMEGFWEENEETKKLINIITLEKFNKMKANINNFYKGPNEINLLYTILVIYYLKTKCSERLDEFRLIINKANKYLEKNGIKYENIISGI